MADPDAPQQDDPTSAPWIHWIQAAFKGNNVNSGRTLEEHQTLVITQAENQHLLKEAEDKNLFTLNVSERNILEVEAAIETFDSSKLI
ncbi:unnamed protein product [Rotaria sordida]|uniref:Uncharacterized protein n=1 Tax=Rotaria sordida TaxID=392033 RepID=A0A819JUC4_9BILA|nr:unnamed protein product [Rotaria sordida]